MAETIEVISLYSKLPAYPNGDFGFLLAALNDEQCAAALTVVPSLLRLNCSQVTCAGLKAEKLHDEIDNIIEGAGRFNILTTFDVSALEACEYFIFAAGSSVAHLVALVADHPDIVKILDGVIEEYESD